VGDTIRPMSKGLSLVPVEQIPKETIDCQTDDLQKLYRTCIQMENVCLINDGVGLSAVQVGVPWKLFIVRYQPPRMPFRYFLNCRYEPITEEKDKSIEGCLSLRQADGRFRHFEVERYKKVRVVGQELTDIIKLVVSDFSFEPDDVYRIVFQHEIDHQNNILISDIGKELNIWK
jgi:peptide deformylase